jgi:hypothetical protein
MKIDTDLISKTPDGRRIGLVVITGKHYKKTVVISLNKILYEIKQVGDRTFFKNKGNRKWTEMRW